jgi:hypothetical protein
MSSLMAVRAIREARNRFDDVLEVALSSNLQEVRALAHLMQQTNSDILFGFCDLYRACEHDETPMISISRGLEAALEGGAEV